MIVCGIGALIIVTVAIVINAWGQSLSDSDRAGLGLGPKGQGR